MRRTDTGTNSLFDGYLAQKFNLSRPDFEALPAPLQDLIAHTWCFRMTLSGERMIQDAEPAPTQTYIVQGEYEAAQEARAPAVMLGTLFGILTLATLALAAFGLVTLAARLI